MKTFKAIHRPSLLPATAATCLAVSFLFTGCSGGGGGGGTGGGGGGGSSDAVTQTLNTLGVDTASTPRQDATGADVPTDFTPFGGAWELSKTSELLVVGPVVNSTGERFSLLDLTAENGDSAEEKLHTLSDADEPWITDNLTWRWFPQTKRDVVCADVDEDGFEELVVVYLDGNELRTRTIEDEAASFVSSDIQVAFESDVTHVTAEPGDFDGDGRTDVAVGLTIAGEEGLLLFLRSTDEGFVEFGQRRQWDPVAFGSTMILTLGAGSVDNDRADELAVAINEYYGSIHTPDGTSRYMLLDDSSAQFAPLIQEQVVQGLDQNGAARTSLMTAVEIADVDGDGVGELLVAGLTSFGRYCDGFGHLMMAFDDAQHGLSPLGNRYLYFYFDDCDSPADPQLRFLHLNALDLDGDGQKEIHVNHFVFDDFVNAAAWTHVEAYSLPESAIFEQNDVGMFGLTTSAMVVGDFTGDDREDIAIYRQDANTVEVWGVDQLDSTISKQRSVACSFAGSGGALQPILVPANVDTDSTVLRYSDGQYQLVFTEPILIAALAAAPHQDGVGQNVSSCVTAFGTTSTSGSSQEYSASVSASASVGVNVDGGFLTQSESEVKVTATVKATAFVNHNYSLSETIVFTTGPAEDTVVFTTVPLDQYTYTVQSHPDPEMVGKEIVVSMPRSPITLQTERSFYNETVEPGSTKVDASVFSHVIGDPASYPTPGLRNSLLNLAGGGLQIGPQAVGQGAGSTELTLEVGEEWGVGGSLEIGYEASFECTGATVLVGASVGASASATFALTSGSSTTYTGIVGSIDQANFAEHGYQFGLFTYVREDPVTGREYEVVNYWVE